MVQLCSNYYVYLHQLSSPVKCMQELRLPVYHQCLKSIQQHSKLTAVIRRNKTGKTFSREKPKVPQGYLTTKTMTRTMTMMHSVTTTPMTAPKMVLDIETLSAVEHITCIYLPHT